LYVAVINQYVICRSKEVFNFCLNFKIPNYGHANYKPMPFGIKPQVLFIYKSAIEISYKIML